MPVQTRSVRRVLVGTAGAAVAATAFSAPAWAQDEHDEVVLSVGHTDAVEVNYVDGELTLNVKDDTVSPPAYRDPADVIFQALPESATEVPDDPRYAFLGEPGETVWMLPQTQDPDVLWPGWSTERLSAGVFQDDSVTLTLENVDGPGEMTIFNIDAFGNPTSGEQVSDTKTVAFAVGDVDPNDAFPSGNGNGDGNGGGNGGGSGGGNMPKTGATIAGIGALAVLLLLGGGALVTYARKANRRAAVPGNSAQA